MLRTKRSKLAASGTFFATAVAALLAVSAQPQQAAAFDGGGCPGSGGPLCATVTYDLYCSDDEGNVWVCGQVTEYHYYDKEETQG